MPSTSRTWGCTSPLWRISLKIKDDLGRHVCRSQIFQNVAFAREKNKQIVVIAFGYGGGGFHPTAKQKYNVIYIAAKCISASLIKTSSNCRCWFLWDWASSTRKWFSGLFAENEPIRKTARAHAAVGGSFLSSWRQLLAIIALLITASNFG